jgi:hypothetical protein
MKSISILNLVKFAACVVLLIGLSTSGFASCGDTLAAMASAHAAVVSQSPSSHQDASPSAKPSNAPIVGLWHVFFTVDGQAIQEAYQLWNAGGTEEHNPNVDPRGGNICFGVWKNTAPGGFKLVHRVWNYDTTGDFLGTINLTEEVKVIDGGATQTGIFKLDFYDPSGNFLTEVAGQATGQRVPVD